MDVYKAKLLMNYRELLKFDEDLLAKNIKVGMTGELVDINDTFQK
jgi:hypothetical protein